MFHSTIFLSACIRTGAPSVYETQQVANQSFGGAFKPTDRVHINGRKLHYNEHCFGVQLWCNNIQFKTIEYLDLKITVSLHGRELSRPALSVRSGRSGRAHTQLLDIMTGRR